MSPQKKNGADARTLAGAARRKKMLQWMTSQQRPVLGTELARHFGVSRQCVVQDVAILRASQNDILSTPQGYRLPPAQKSSAHRHVIACQHPPHRTEEELTLLVDLGVRVVDVVVEHPLYGELRGSLTIESRSDVAEFMRRWRTTKASLLSSLTRGVHLHTIEAKKPEILQRAKKQLRERGFLLQ